MVINAPPARSDLNKLVDSLRANPYLVTATVLMLIAVVAFELRLRARGCFDTVAGPCG